MPGRYASALFELSKEQNQLEAVEADLVSFESLIDDSDDLKRLVRSPVYSAEDQLRALSAVLDKAGLSSLAGNFLKLIARNRRLFAVEGMIKIFRDLAARDRGEVQADVTSATPLSDEQIESLKAKLKASIGQDVQLNTRVDPSVLGGLIVKVGSRMIDSSLRTKLATLKMRMKEVG
ncbi:MAG: F0F1 ATP synthase subunit delta [Pseudomonadota bacterium]